MITEQEVELAQAICFSLCYGILVVFFAVWVITNIISLNKKGKKK